MISVIVSEAGNNVAQNVGLLVAYYFWLTENVDRKDYVLEHSSVIFSMPEDALAFKLRFGL